VDAIGDADHGGEQDAAGEGMGTDFHRHTPVTGNGAGEDSAKPRGG
jgi:hypothetical protein